MSVVNLEKYAEKRRWIYLGNNEYLQQTYYKSDSIENKFDNLIKLYKKKGFKENDFISISDKYKEIIYYKYKTTLTYFIEKNNKFIVEKLILKTKEKKDLLSLK